MEKTLTFFERVHGRILGRARFRGTPVRAPVNSDLTGST